ncbi:hypothetical protein ACWGMV_31665, partial [Streptomyces albidoflavus]
MSDIQTAQLEKYKNLDQWKVPVYTFPDIDAVIRSGFPEDGIYQIKQDGVQYFDVLIRNTHKLSEADNLIVCFNGAVSSRGTKKGPFFSGLSITEGLDVPCIFISDPSLDLPEKITLGWYGGNEYQPNLQLNIIGLLNAIAQAYELKLLLIGGSGAGYSVLSITQRLVTGSLALVWNPQTSISKYFHHFVERYLRAAFPTKFGEMARRFPTLARNKVQFNEKVLASTGITHSLTEKGNEVHNPIIYLQNRHDWHVENHANPYLSNWNEWNRVAPAVFLNDSKKIGLVMGDWGSDHAVPPKALLLSLIKFGLEIDANTVFENNVEQFLKFFAAEERYDWILSHDRKLGIEIKYQFDSGRNVLKTQSVALNSDPNETYSYAFYLVINEE